jgi:hypothetical protein
MYKTVVMLIAAALRPHQPTRLHGAKVSFYLRFFVRHIVHVH